jgi:hypothetical protein
MVCNLYDIQLEKLWVPNLFFFEKRVPNHPERKTCIPSHVLEIQILAPIFTLRQNVFEVASLKFGTFI